MENDKRYKTFSFRLNENTVDLLRELRIASGKSWNRFIFNLAVEHANTHKIKYREEIFAPKYKKHKKGVCEECGSPGEMRPGKYLGVHHMDGDITNNSIENLKTVCPPCHAKQYPR